MSLRDLAKASLIEMEAEHNKLSAEIEQAKHNLAALENAWRIQQSKLQEATEAAKEALARHREYEASIAVLKKTKSELVDQIDGAMLKFAEGRAA